MDETKHILVYSDSLTWGIIPGTRQRLPFASRWPGVIHKALNVGGERIRVTEDCLNGRRTVFDDPHKPGMPVPPILIVAPPQLDDPRGPIGPKFAGGDVASRGLADAIRQVSEDTGCAFFDANSVTTSSTVNGVYLDAAQHETLGRALTPVVAELLRSA